MSQNILYGIDGIDDVFTDLENEETDLNVQAYLQKVLVDHVDELNRNNEILQNENEKLRVQLKSQSNESNNSNNGDGAIFNGVENNNLSFTFTTDNPMLQMHELTKEMEALKALSHSRDYLNGDSRANSDILSTDSGHTSSQVSDFGSRLNISAAADMARVQRSQFKIQELEKEAERARFCNRNLMQEYAEQLKDKSRILGDAVSKARPYFDALRKSKKAKQRTQYLANQYTRAQQVWRASRELVKAGEDKMMNGLKTPSDMQWLEMLNEANEKANEASMEKARIQQLHEESAQNYRLSEEVAAALLKSEQKSIKKAKSYFDLKIELETKLEDSRKRMQEIDLKVVEAKAELSASLQRLGNQSQNNIPDSESSKDGSELNGSLPNIPTDPPIAEDSDDGGSQHGSDIDGFIEDF